MAKFLGLATDFYKEPANYHYESTLTKTVTQASTHTHHGPLLWIALGNISCKAPNITEEYSWMLRIVGLDLYLLACKGLIVPVNLSVSAYSYNFSGLYVNLSGMITNTGLPYFILPSATRKGAAFINFNRTGILQEQMVAKQIEARKNKKKAVIIKVYDVDRNLVS